MTKVRKNIYFFLEDQNSFEKFCKGFKKFDNYVVFVPSNIKIEDKFYKNIKKIYYLRNK